MLSRRSLIAAMCAAALLPLDAAASDLHDVQYFAWTPDISVALDQLAVVKDAVDSEGKGTLEVVKQGNNFGVINRVGASPIEAKRLAMVHSVALRGLEDTEEELAHAIPRSNYSRVYNVSYGLGPNLSVLVQHFDKVSGLLGGGVARSLVIERTDHGNYALVYKRYGDIESTRGAAARHDQLLRRTGIRASIIQEQSFSVVYDGTTIYSEPEVLLPEPLGELVVIAPPEPDRVYEPVPDDDGYEYEPGLDFIPEPGTEVVFTPPDSPDDPEDEPDNDAVTDVDIELPDEPAAADVVDNTELSTLLNDFLRAEKKAGRISADERTAWLVVDVNAKKTLAAVNADVSMQAASMIKPFAMLAFFHEVNRGRFSYGSVSRGKLELMIQKSNNAATNWVIDQVGGPAAVQRILDQNYSHITKHTKVVERIPNGGATYRNKASASDYGRYMQAVWFGELPQSKEQLRLLNLPGRDRIYNGAPNIPTGTAVYNKTGSTARCCGDMGILVARTPSGKPVPYVIVGIIDKASRASSYSTWITDRSNLIRAVSDRVYVNMKAQYNLA